MTVPLSLKSKHTMIYGLKGSGKSNFTQWLLRRHADLYASNLTYDVCKEHGYGAVNRYTPTHRRGEEAETELDAALSKWVVDAPRSKRPELVIIEEISRFCGPNSPPPEALYDLIDLNRHYGVGLIGVARRPAQVHTDLTELADNILIFRLTGKNDKRRLNREVEGLGDAVADLGEYEFMHVGPSRDYRVCAPVEEMDSTGKL